MNRELATGCAFLAIALLLWAGNAVVTRAAMLEDVPPLAFNFWRWTVAFAIFVPFTARRVWRQRRVFLDKWWFFVVFGIVSIAVFNSFYYVGLQYTTAVQGSLIMALLPVTVLVSVAVLLHVPITVRQTGGVVLSMTGAAVILLRGEPALVRTFVLNIGDLWCLAAMVVWSWQIMLMRWKPASLDMPSFMTVVIAIAVVFQTPAYLWEAAAGRSFVPTTENLAFLGYVAVVASVFGTTLYNAGVVKAGPTTAGHFGNVYPVFGAALAVIFLGEPFEWFHGAGGVLVLAGIYLATVVRNRAPGGT